MAIRLRKIDMNELNDQIEPASKEVNNKPKAKRKESVITPYISRPAIRTLHD